MKNETHANATTEPNMFAIKTPIGFFCGIDQQHFVAQVSEDLQEAKTWKTKKAATAFLNEWAPAGVGLSPDSEIVSL